MEALTPGKKLYDKYMSLLDAENKAVDTDREFLQFFKKDFSKYIGEKGPVHINVDKMVHDFRSEMPLEFEVIMTFSYDGENARKNLWHKSFNFTAKEEENGVWTLLEQRNRERLTIRRGNEAENSRQYQKILDLAEALFERNGKKPFTL